MIFKYFYIYLYIKKEKDTIWEINLGGNRLETRHKLCSNLHENYGAVAHMLTAKPRI